MQHRQAARSPRIARNRLAGRIVFAGLLSAGILYGQGAGRVQFRDWKAPAATAKPKTACGSLRALTGYDLSITGAVTVPATADAPAHCRVRLFIQPQLNVEVNLPAAWNGRFYMFGNGGFAGESFDAASRVADRARGLRAGFVVASTDTGHSAAAEPSATFARNRQELLDYAFRAVHLSADTAKTLIRAYYGTGPSKSYFDGCSQGGREALMEAERFPNDFDGILSGSPMINFTGTMLARSYWSHTLPATPVEPAKMKLLSDTVYAKCDARDGLKDGVIDDPRRCDFDARRDLPRCSVGADRNNCFTTDEIASITRIHADVTSQGKRIFSGFPVGSEVAPDRGQSGWIGEVLPTANGRAGAWRSYADGFLPNFAFPPPDPSSTVAGFDVEHDPERLVWLHDIIDATDPDLTAFHRRNGKLIIYYGWADPQLNPMMAVEYYEDLTAEMGPTTDSFARLFMVPGMFHCGGGIGTSTFDADTPLIKWVETGVAPKQISASRVVSGKVVRTRPLCPYPETAHYKGSGSIDEAANFSCTKP